MGKYKYTLVKKIHGDEYTVSNKADFKPKEGQAVKKIWRGAGYCWFAFPRYELTAIKTNLDTADGSVLNQQYFHEEAMKKWES